MRKFKTLRAKGLVAGVATALVMAGAPAVYAATCGDSDNSGSVAVNDVVQHELVVAGINSASALCGGSGYNNCADMDGDGTGPQIADTGLLLNIVAGIANCASDTCVPQQIVANGATLPKPINTNVIVKAGTTALVDGLTYVQPGASLTVEHGGSLEGVVEDPPSAVIAKPGAHVFMQGTLAQPIVLTSHAAPGTRNRQDWGGIVLLGSAGVNLTDAHVEGVPETVDTIYGGNNDNDFSGCLKYARLDFSGRELTPDNELNTWTFAGVGRKTVVDHIEGNRGFDDSTEWFGGSVNSTFIVNGASGDDNLDTQLGTTGAIQWDVAMQEAGALETPGCNGFEQDNSEFSFTANNPYNYPKYCNVTMFGARYNDAINPGITNNFGILSRRGNASQIWNTILKDFRGAGLQIRDPETSQHYCTSRSGLKRCVNGPHDGSACVETGVPYTTCYDGSGSKICVAGTNAGTACTTNSQCPDSSCMNDPDIVCTDSHMAGLCEGGSNAGNECTTGADCPGGSCPGTAGAVAPFARMQGVIMSNNAVPAADNSTCASNNVPAATPIACQCSSTEYYALCKHEGNCITDNQKAGGGGVLDGYGTNSFPRTGLVPSGAVATLLTSTKRADCSTKDSFFVNAPYVGAFDPSGSDWTSGWTAFPFN
jgi:hypothetical protein